MLPRPVLCPLRFLIGGFVRVPRSHTESLGMISSAVPVVFRSAPAIGLTSSNVPSRSRQAGDEAAFHGIAIKCHDVGCNVACLAARVIVGHGNHDVYLEADAWLRVHPRFRASFSRSHSMTRFSPHVTKLAQALPKRLERATLAESGATVRYATGGLSLSAAPRP